MRVISTIGMIAAACLSISGCSHFLDRPVTTRSMKKDHARVIVTYGNYKTGIWINNKYCEAAQPDVGVSLETTLNTLLKASGPTGGETDTSSGEAKLDLLQNSVITALDGRTQTVLITRDILFNTCLLSANELPENNPAWSRLDATIDLVKKMVQVGQTQAEAVKSAAESTSSKEESTDGATHSPPT